MCGISAVYHLNHSLVNIDKLIRSCSTIAHRGPDGAAYATLSQGQLGLGSVRLSIVDVDGGMQPLFSIDKNIALVCNGEIYDYQIWKTQLQSEGYIFQTNSDSELIIHLYNKFGVEFLRKLNGEFAFVLWDERKKQLLVARDRSGVKPLFYYLDSKILIISSEIKGIFSYPEVPRQISLEYLSTAALGMTTGNALAFDEINNLRPGHYFTIKNAVYSGEIGYQNWDFNPDYNISFQDSIELVRSSIKNAVLRRLVADVPVNCYLSGGLDSTIICGLMSEHVSKFTAFHASFPNSRFDESQQAGMIASHFGQTMETIHCTNELLVTNLLDTVKHVEMPLPNCNSIAKFLLSRFVNLNNGKVCITGEGADEVFGGYAYFKLEHIWQKRLSSALSKNEFDEMWNRFQKLEYRSLGLNWNKTNAWKKNNSKYTFPNYLYLNSIKTGSIIPWLFQEVFNRDYLAEKVLDYYPPNKINNLHPFNASRLMSFETLAGGIIPLLGDRVEMANSLECRTPFLDTDVIDLATKFPPEHFINLKELRGKYVLHQAFKDFFPEKLKQTQKHPFLSPSWKSILANPKGYELLNEYLSTDRIKRLGIFDPLVVNTLKMIWLKGSEKCSVVKRLDPLIGILLTTHMLHELFIENNEHMNKNFVMEDRSIS